MSVLGSTSGSLEEQAMLLNTLQCLSQLHSPPETFLVCKSLNQRKLDCRSRELAMLGSDSKHAQLGFQVLFLLNFTFQLKFCSQNNQGTSWPASLHRSKCTVSGRLKGKTDMKQNSRVSEIKDFKLLLS